MREQYRAYEQYRALNNYVPIITAEEIFQSSLSQFSRKYSEKSLLNSDDFRAGNNGRSSLWSRDFSEYFQPNRKSLSSAVMTARYFQPWDFCS